MNLTDQEIIELHELLNGLVENNLPPAKFKRLEDWILSSEVVRQRYVSFMDMSSSLSHYAEEIVTDEDNTDECEEVEQKNLIRFSRPILAIVALLVLVITLFNFKDSSPTNDGPKQIASERVGEASDYASTAESTVFAVLTNSVGLSWAKDTKHRPKLGQTLEKCILGVDEGLVQLEFIRGSTVILEGPVEFEIKGTNEGILKSGKEI